SPSPLDFSIKFLFRNKQKKSRTADRCMKYGSASCPAEVISKLTYVVFLLFLVKSEFRDQRFYCQPLNDQGKQDDRECQQQNRLPAFETKRQTERQRN